MIFPATGEWILISGQGTITDPTDPNTTVTDLGFGENIFRWRVNNQPCVPGITNDLVSIFLFNQSNPVANAGSDQALCTPASSTTLDLPAQATCPRSLTRSSLTAKSMASSTPASG